MFPRFGYFISRQPVESVHPSTTHLDVHGRNLQGLEGAQYIVDTLERIPTIKHLILGNNSFGDNGVAALFQYLTSERGTRLQIVEISLNSCDIGNLGLRAICGYLNGNVRLKSLYLQNNEFNPSWALCSTFTSAINNSQLKTLSLTSNPHLSDTFLFRFLPNLSTPYLQELHLSAIGLTSVSTPHIVAFLSSDLPLPSSTSSTEDDTPTISLLKIDKYRPTTRLKDLRLNGNTFTLACAASFVHALEHNNFSIRHLEMYANRFYETTAAPPPPTQPSVAPPTPPSLTPTGLLARLAPQSDDMSWDDLKSKLSQIYARNHLLIYQTRIAALRLLSPARCLLLPPSRPSKSESRINGWNALPTELQQYILATYSPALSPTQYIQIWNYVSDRRTLRRSGGVLSQLKPEQMAFSEGHGKDGAGKVPNDKDGWLELVGCERFEWYKGWQQDFASIKW
ncbi:hypothetical protein FRB95_007428 [Tulasnella sp. JGI-2019a]|nr:hypothetical protein FRB93_011727 [Tulasnella sp. JGI-2019a]KAG9027731.1 hypothetical protein FRB95_007428 [Tulasnella sp. JGI-2019a]